MQFAPLFTRTKKVTITLEINTKWWTTLKQVSRVFEYSCPGIRRFEKNTIKDEKEMYTYSLKASKWREKKIE